MIFALVIASIFTAPYEHDEIPAPSGVRRRILVFTGKNQVAAFSSILPSANLDRCLVFAGTAANGHTTDMRCTNSGGWTQRLQRGDRLGNFLSTVKHGRRSPHSCCVRLRKKQDKAVVPAQAAQAAADERRPSTQHDCCAAIRCL